jgi:hypothetical protein
MTGSPACASSSAGTTASEWLGPARAGPDRPLSDPKHRQVAGPKGPAICRCGASRPAGRGPGPGPILGLRAPRTASRAAPVAPRGGAGRASALGLTVSRGFRAGGCGALRGVPRRGLRPSLSGPSRPGSRGWLGARGLSTLRQRYKGLSGSRRIVRELPKCDRMYL